MDPLWHTVKNSVEIRDGIASDRSLLSQLNINPSWFRLLTSDFSPTSYFEELTGEKIEIDLISTDLDVHDDNAPIEVKLISEPHIRRQTWLRTASGKRIAYAVSWWSRENMDFYIKNPDQTIWANLDGIGNLNRIITHFLYGDSDFFEKAFQKKGPFCGRYYMFGHGKSKIALIQEIFSSGLSEYLGPIARIEQ